ncbi:hypothetical protein AGIG_G13583 [Arapaima gigas]
MRVADSWSGVVEVSRRVGESRGVRIKPESRATLNKDSLENGNGGEGGGEGEPEIIWKRREGVAEKAKEEPEPQREYIVWRKREGFKEKTVKEETLREDRRAEQEPEVVWRKREVEEDRGRERPQPIERGHETIWRKRERE